MKITTKYNGPTDTRGARIIARSPLGQISIPYPYALSGEAVFRKAAERLVLRHASRGFAFTLGSGQSLERGGYSFTLNHTEK